MARALKVLCVEDDPDMMFLVRMVLSEPDWQLFEAADGMEALDVLDGADPDIALLDYMLPGMDGIELAGKVRARMPKCPIVLFSAHPMVAEQADASESIDAFVPKTEVVGLDEALRRVLADRSRK